MVNQQKMIDQLKKQIKDLRKSNKNLKLQLEKTKIDQLDIQTDENASTLEINSVRERLTTILESTSDFVSTSTPDLKITYINKAGMRMIGIKSGILPKNLNILEFHPQWALEIIQNEGIPKAISEGIWRGETAFLKSDGTEIPISQVIMSHKSQNGEVGYLSTIIRDISELKDIEKKLVEGENQYRMLIENIPDVTWKSTSDGGTTFISPNIKDILGYTQKEIIDGDVSWFDMIHGEDRELVEKSFQEIFTKNKEYDIKYRIFSKDRTLKWIYDRAFNPVSEEGEKLIVYGIFSDITDKKKAEEELEYYLEFEKIVSRISAELINIHVNEIDNAIENALKDLVQFTNTTRGNVYIFSNNLTEFSCSHEWCIDKKYTQKALFKKMQSKRFPYITKILKEFKPLILSEPAKIHQKASGAKKWQKKYGYRPAIIIPMIFENKLFGMLEINGKDDEKRYWSNKLISLLKFLSGIFVSALERKITEEKLRESEGKFRLISEQSLLGILIIQNDIIKYTNEAVSDIIGYSKEQIITGLPMDYSTIFHPEDWKFVMEQSRLKQRDEEGAIISYKLRVLPIKKTGEIKWIEIYSHTILYMGRPAELVTLINVDQKMKTEFALKESEEKFRMISEQSLMGILIVQNENIIYRNDTVFKIFEYTDEEMMSWKPREYLKFLHPDDLKFVMEQSRIKQNDEEGAIINYNLRAFTKTGKIIWIEIFSHTISYLGKPADLVTMIDVTEKVRAEAALKESEEKFRMLSEQSLMGMLIIQDNVIKYANEALSQISEYSVKEMYSWESNKIFQLIHPEDKKFVMEQARIKQTGLKNAFIPHHSYRIITKTGKIKWVDNYSKTIQYGDKAADFITMIDNTETKIAEKAKQESENRYQNLVETMNEGLAIIDINNKITYVNPKLIQMVEYSEKELLDKTIYDFFGEKDIEIVMDQFSKHKKGLPGLFEMEWHKKDGGILYVMISTQPIIIEHGNNTGSVVVVTDITNLKKNETELKESEEKFRELLDNTQNVIYKLNLQTLAYDYVSPSVERVLGYTIQEYTETNVSKATVSIHPEDYQKALEYRKEIMKSSPGGTNFFSWNMRFKHKNGEYRWFKEQSRLIWDNNGNPLYIVSSMTDITEITNSLKEKESLMREIESRTRVLEKNLKEKESLVREIHHRVKNNLQVISAITLMHEDSLKEEKASIIFKEYQNRIKAMAKIHETLYKSEIIERIDLEGYILDLIQNLILSYNVDQKRIKIIPKIDNLDLNISKAMHYGLIINELISNALKHAFPKNGKGRISVSILKGEGNLITLIVEDDGLGLPSEINYTNPSTMGMKIIKTSTDQLKGEIILEKNKGTKWKITFHS